jgi:hypothetical protein
MLADPSGRAIITALFSFAGPAGDHVELTIIRWTGLP